MNKKELRDSLMAPEGIPASLSVMITLLAMECENRWPGKATLIAAYGKIDEAYPVVRLFLQHPGTTVQEEGNVIRITIDMEEEFDFLHAKYVSYHDRSYKEIVYQVLNIGVAPVSEKFRTSQSFKEDAIAFLHFSRFPS